MLFGDETSGNHQAYRRGHLDLKVISRFVSAYDFYSQVV